jgi:uncharacterized protein YgiM (DUF1202 family)
MSKKKKSSILPKVELIIIGVFICFFLVWSVSRCNTTRAKYAELEEQVEEAQARADSIASQASPQQQAPPAQKEKEDVRSADEIPRTIRERYTPLYVTLDNLNVRSDPGLNGKIITELKLYDEVTFLNEVTNFEQEINLGFEVTKAPWVKIKTERGYVGWVYGAGVHYYKKSRKPLEEAEEDVN